MKRKFTYYIFLATICSLFLFILFIKPDKKFLFQNAIGDCSGRTEFIYDVLYHHPSQFNADVVLFGSSRTMNGFNDSTIGKTTYLNLGYCRFGRNLDAYFIEEYLKNHTPSKIVVEIRESEGNNSHPLTPFLLPVSQITEGFISPDLDVFKHLSNKWLYNLKYLRGCFFSKKTNSEFNNLKEKGFWENKEITLAKNLVKQKINDSIKLSNTTFQKESLNHNSKYYLNRIQKLCDKKHITLYFLYMPSYGNLTKKPHCENDYLKYGEVIVLEDDIFNNVDYYANYDHLSKKGSYFFSLRLKKILKEK